MKMLGLGVVGYFWRFDKEKGKRCDGMNTVDAAVCISVPALMLFLSILLHVDDESGASCNDHADGKQYLPFLLNMIVILRVVRIARIVRYYPVRIASALPPPLLAQNISCYRVLVTIKSNRVSWLALCVFVFCVCVCVYIYADIPVFAVTLQATSNHTVFLQHNRWIYAGFDLVYFHFCACGLLSLQSSYEFRRADGLCGDLAAQGVRQHTKLHGLFVAVD